MRYGEYREPTTLGLGRHYVLSTNKDYAHMRTFFIGKQFTHAGYAYMKAIRIRGPSVQADYAHMSTELFHRQGRRPKVFLRDLPFGLWHRCSCLVTNHSRLTLSSSNTPEMFMSTATSLVHLVQTSYPYLPELVMLAVPSPHFHQLLRTMS